MEHRLQRALKQLFNDAQPARERQARDQRLASLPTHLPEWLRQSLADGAVMVEPSKFGVTTPVRLSHASQCGHLRLACLAAGIEDLTIFTPPMASAADDPIVDLYDTYVLHNGNSDGDGSPRGGNSSQPRLTQPDDSQVLLKGTAVPYGIIVDIAGPTMFQHGCFAADLAKPGADHALLSGFDEAYLLGRCRRNSGTAMFYENNQGLQFECYPPDTSFTRNILVSLQRGDVTGTTTPCFADRWHFMTTSSDQRVRVVTRASFRVTCVTAFARFDGVSITSTPHQPVRLPSSSNSHTLNSLTGAH